MSTLIFLFCREYSVGEFVTYMCLDSTLGENGGYLNKVSFECKHDIPYVLGEFNVPKNDDRWPVCQSKTTTIIPGK